MPKQAPASSPIKQALIISDGKPGHFNQSLGLVAALQSILETNYQTQLNYQILAPLSWPEAIAALSLKRCPQAWRQLRQPQLVIATGSHTHASLLAAGRLFDAFTLVLCSSSFPARWFDLNVIPEHDQRNAANNKIMTKGVLNRIIPTQLAEKNRGLILIGGKSKHYQWSDTQINQQLQTLIAKRGDFDWLITNSRRTPEAFTAQLEKAVATLNQQTEPGKRRINFTTWQATPENWVMEQLQRAAQVWVTPDSVSMVYEALTAGNQVYLFQLDSQNTKVAQSIEQLRGRETGWLNKGRLIAPRKTGTIWEAQRVAQEVIKRMEALEPI